MDIGNSDSDRGLNVEGGVRARLDSIMPSLIRLRARSDLGVSRLGVVYHLDISGAYAVIYWTWAFGLYYAVCSLGLSVNQSCLLDRVTIVKLRQ